MEYWFSDFYVARWLPITRRSNRWCKDMLPINLLIAKFSFKNPLQAAQIKWSNDEYTRRSRGKSSYYRFYEK